MSEFIQFHVLTAYPPSNLNRDDLGKPKTAVVGGSQRLRVSSQSLKRAWRKSSFFQEALAGHIGIRTKEIGVRVEEALANGKDFQAVLEGKADEVREPVDAKKAKEYSIEIAKVFGKCKKDSPEHEQMVHYSPEEIVVIGNLVARIAESGQPPEEKELDLLRSEHTGVDIAMFGRMLANSPAYNTEAAVQVAHGITVHDVTLEDDYFTAVDDLNTGIENVGAAHIGELEFASGLFYQYICINRDLLVENLGGDEELASKAIRALAEAVVKVGPSGKQNSFASRAYASYMLAERGTQQPRALSVAYLKAVKDADVLGASISRLKETREKMDAVYGPCNAGCEEMDAHAGTGSLDAVLDFVSAR